LDCAVFYVTSVPTQYRLYGRRFYLTAHQPFTLVHTGQYRTEDKLKIQTLYSNETQAKKQTTQNTAKNYPGLVAFYDTQSGNEVG